MSGVANGLSSDIDDAKGMADDAMTAAGNAASSAEDAKKVATNYLYYDSTNGLVITQNHPISELYPISYLADGNLRLTGTGVYIGQQSRKHFGIAYRSLIGNDEDGNNHGYKIHVIYDCLASPSEKQHSTVNDSPDISPFSWTVSTTPVEMGVTDAQPSAAIEIDSTKVDSTALTSIENLLYGTNASGTAEGTDPTLPTPAQLFALVGYTAQTNG